MSLTYTAQEPGISVRKSGAIVAVVLLHLGFLYAFTQGMSMTSMMQPVTKTIAVLIAAPPRPQESLPVIKPEPVKMPVKKLVAELPPLVPTVEPQMDMVVPDDSVATPSGMVADVPGITQEPQLRSVAIKHQVDPQYPAASRRAGEAGTVLLNVVVGPDGVPTDIVVERSSGFAALDQAALLAVRKWRFAVNADSGYSRVRLPITFKLETSR